MDRGRGESHLTMNTFPEVGVAGIVRLLGALLVARMRGRDRITVLDHWARRHSEGQDAVIVNLGFKKLMLVTGPGLSAHVLADPPSQDSFITGNVKRKSMAWFAPHALTISDGQEWVERREFNEQVLCTGRAHDLSQTVHRHVNEAFSTPLGTTAEVHERMATLMREVVVGGTSPKDLPAEVDALICVVQSPVKRAALGWRYARRRRRFYEVIDQRWDDAPDHTLVGRARTYRGASEETIEQIPHWLFTFTGSATTLLSRTLAIVASRPDVQASLAAEVLALGGHDDASAVAKLEYAEACLRETGRLFPPVTKTFHVAPRGGEFDGRRIPAGTEIVHFFPLYCRNEGDPTTHDFQPERWMSDPPPVSNLFLTGARSCPAEDLILFICKAALARASWGPVGGAQELASDPLPRSFPVTNVTLRP